MQQLDLNDMSDFSMPDIEGDAAAQAAFQQIEQAVKIHAPNLLIDGTLLFEGKWKLLAKSSTGELEGLQLFYLIGPVEPSSQGAQFHPERRS